MVYTSEIEKLERRWAENPKGRNFAPLADAYRKAGELDRALELCKAGLERHPDYVSAHIVYGRCLIDQKNDPGASDVFRKVLALDPENVLALRILAEIAERGGRFDEAVDWLGRLLAADPMNGEAAEALTRAKAKAAVTSSPKAPEPVARLVPETPAPPPVASRPGAVRPAPAAPPPPPPPPPPPDIVIEHASDDKSATTLDTKGGPTDLETFDGTINFNSAARDQARADGIEVQEEIQLKPQDLVVEGLAHTQFETVFTTPPEPTVSEDDLAKIDLPLIMPDDLSGMVAAPPPAPMAPAPAAQRAPAVSVPVPPPPPPPLPAAVTMSDDDGAADAAALSRAEPVLTETMAELYLRQGHEEDALRVYEALLAQRPGDARLRNRIASLRRGAGLEGRGGGEGVGTEGETVQAFLKRLLAGRPGSVTGHEAGTAPPLSPVVDSQLEQALGRGMAGAGHTAGAGEGEGEAEPRIWAPGEATRPATDGISLDQVFGDEGPRSSGAPAPSPLPPAPPSPPPPPAPSAAQPSGGFSFDQFFSTTEPEPSAEAGAGGEGGPGGAGAVPPPRTSGGAPRPPVEDESDLDQFQAWLRGLKS